MVPFLFHVLGIYISAFSSGHLDPPVLSSLERNWLRRERGTRWRRIESKKGVPAGFSCREIGYRERTIEEGKAGEDLR